MDWSGAGLELSWSWSWSCSSGEGPDGSSAERVVRWAAGNSVEDWPGRDDEGVLCRGSDTPHAGVCKALHG